MPTVLIIFAHMEKTSFNAALMDTAVTTLQGQGHKVIVSDLYAMNFNPVMSRSDKTDAPSTPDHFDYTDEMGAAVLKGTVAQDIQEEQRKISQADLIIFQFPIQWNSIPAILQGWFDRVFLENFVFEIAAGKFYENGLLKGKKSLLSVTTGSAKGFYTASGLHGDIKVHLYPLQGTLRMVGLDILQTNICYSPKMVTSDDREEMLLSWSTRLKTIFDETPLTFPLMSEHKPVNGDYAQGLELPEDYKGAGDESGEYGASVGQHMNRKVPLE